MHPGPLRVLAAAALKPWWGGGAAEESEHEKALRELMGWGE